MRRVVTGVAEVVIPLRVIDAVAITQTDVRAEAARDLDRHRRIDLPVVRATFIAGAPHREEVGHNGLAIVTLDPRPAPERARLTQRRTTACAVVAEGRGQRVPAFTNVQPHVVLELHVGVDIAAELLAETIGSPLRPLVEVRHPLTVDLRRLAELDRIPEVLVLAVRASQETEVVD